MKDAAHSYKLLIQILRKASMIFINYKCDDVCIHHFRGELCLALMALQLLQKEIKNKSPNFRLRIALSRARCFVFRFCLMVGKKVSREEGYDFSEPSN